MRGWTFIICEGAHDQKFLAALAQLCGGWTPVKNAPRVLPSELQDSYPNPRVSRQSGRHEFQWTPDYLTKNDSFLVIRSFGGKDGVLGQRALDALGQVEPDAVGAFVDANDDGVGSRAASFQEWYGRIYGHAAEARPGIVVAGKPHIGFWVAPDNLNNGHLDELVLTAAQRSKRKLVERGKRFITSMEKVEAGQLTKHRTKAILGAKAQVEVPGGSLAVAIREAGGWLDPNMGCRPPFKSIVQFLEDLTSAAVGSSDQRDGDRAG